MRVLIAGSRDYQKLDAVEAYVNKLPPGTLVIHGGARGVDTVAGDAALRRGLTVLCMRADWKTHGKSAGYRRNEEMVAKADHVAVFWSERSPGSKHTIEISRRECVTLEVYGAEGQLLERIGVPDEDEWKDAGPCRDD